MNPTPVTLNVSFAPFYGTYHIKKHLYIRYFANNIIYKLCQRHHKITRIAGRQFCSTKSNKMNYFIPVALLTLSGIQVTTCLSANTSILSDSMSATL